MFDIISIGDCTTDHLFKISDAHLGHVRRGEVELCLDFGQKIPVEKYAQTVAGNNANNVIGASKLGLKVAIYTNVGSDADGKKIIEKFKEEKIDTRYIKVNLGMDSNVSAVIDFQGERTILTYHQPWDYQLPDLDKTKWVYLSSMADSFSKTSIMGQLQNYLERTGAKLFFNPGTFQLKYGVKKLTRILSLTSVLIANLEEAKLILGFENGEKVEMKKLLKLLQNLGPEKVVITDGSKGSFGFDGQSFYQMDVFPANLVEMTGAGDAYAIGFLAGFFYGKDFKEAMRYGAVNSASVIEHIGPQAGLLTYEQMQEKLKENQKVVAKNL